MMIKKFLHSCVLVEEGGKRLLIDPGRFSFIEGTLTPADIGPVDVIIFTHKHLDHYDPVALKEFQKMKRCTIVTHHDISDALSQEGFSHERIEAGQTASVEGFAITAFPAPHGPIPTEIPHNLAYGINGQLLHPGDSFSVPEMTGYEVVAMPVIAPWARLVDALAFAQRLSPQTVIPIHDAILKEFMLERIYDMCGKKLEEHHIAFRPLSPADELTV